MAMTVTKSIVLLMFKFKTMKAAKTFKLNLNSNEFQSGLCEIENLFASIRKDDYLTGLVSEVQNANQTLLNSMHVAAVKRNVGREAQLLTSRIVSAQRYVDSCRYLDDENVKASAERVLALFKSYDKAFALMKIDTRIGAVHTLQRDLASDEMQTHIARLPELASRIDGILQALQSLEENLLEMDLYNSAALEGQPLLPLKRDAADKLRQLVEYLAVMSAKEPENFGRYYQGVMEIINRLNAVHKKGSTNTPVAAPLTLAVEPEPTPHEKVG